MIPRQLPIEDSLRRVLIANHDVDLRSLLANTVASELRGCAVECVGSLGSALESIKSHPPDAVVVDLSLPGPRTAQVVRGLRNRSPRLVIVGITGIAGAHHRDRMSEAGADHCLHHPVDPMELVRCLVRIARRRADPA